MDASRPLLEVQNLHVTFETPQGPLKAVDGVSYCLERGELLGIVGESGSGKTVQSRALLGLLPPTGQITDGRLLFEGQDLQDKANLKRLRGRQIGMVFQDPAESLNPFYTIGRQLTEAGSARGDGLSGKARREKAAALLHDLGIPDPQDCMKRYAHELSGGQRQRVMLAIALMEDPALLIADEPTTALDVSLQAQILELLRQIVRERNLSVLFITHNLAVVQELCQRLLVMYAGVILEEGPVSAVLARPQSPYTRGLLQSIPHLAERSSLICIPGAPPDPLHPPAGCPFAPRCAQAMPRCHAERPVLHTVSPGHRAACHLLKGGDADA